MISSPAPSAVIFDFYGTLTVGTSIADRDAARHAVAEVLGADPDRFAAAIRETFDARASGRTGDPAQTMRWLARRCEIEADDEKIARACEARLVTERPFMRPRPEAIEVMAALKATGLRVGVLSDCTHELPMCWSGLPFTKYVDAAVFSVEVGTHKPDPAMYAEICGRLGVEASQCIYVGDGGSNELTGARRVGMRAIQLCGPESATAHTYNAEAAWDGAVMTDLRELLERGARMLVAKDRAG